MGNFRGYISRQYTVWCGECGNWEQVDAEQKKDAEARFRKMNWQYTEKNGWICKPCRDRLRMLKNVLADVG